MPHLVDTISGPISYEAALVKQGNVVADVAYLAETNELRDTLWNQRQTIQALVKHHLGLSDEDSCIVKPPSEWLYGGFNACIPVEAKSSSFCKKAMFRCAMPHKLSEARYPGSVDEKISSEVGTYVWMQDRCSDVRIPHLYGFGFSDHRHFTHEQQRPFYIRLARMFRRTFQSMLWSMSGKRLPFPTLSHYTPNSTSQRLPTAYMLLEYIDNDTGEMLTRTWPTQRRDPIRRGTLFRGMARIMLSLARFPQPRIGSLEFNDDCTITLTNRPLIFSIPIWENNGAPRTIPTRETYTYTESFVADMLAFNDNAFISDRTTIDCGSECRGQLAARTLLKAVSHHYVKRERRSGPFLLQLTGDNMSNIFVDKDWNVTCLLDLEWVCSLPADMISAPYWLTGRGIDQITDEHLDEYAGVRQEFMNIFKEEELKMALNHTPALSTTMDENWESGGVWFWHCVTSMNAMYSLFEFHVSRKFVDMWSVDDERVAYRYWSQGSTRVILNKVSDWKEYIEELKVIFGVAADQEK